MANDKTPNPPTPAPAAQDDLWLVSYADDDDRELTAAQVAIALERGEIDANTIVWRDGMPEWKAIAEVEALRSQLRKVSHAPENLRRRQTVLGGFGPAPRQVGAPTPPAPGATPPPVGFDDDEPTVIQQPPMDGFSSAPNQVRPDPAMSRSRHPTSGNTLRIKTGEPPPVTPREQAQDRITPSEVLRAPRSDASHRAPAPSEPELESLPSALLVTATGAVNVSHKRPTPVPQAPTRGVMSRQSDPPGTPLGSNIPRAALTRDPDSDAPPAPKRVTDAPKPPLPRHAAASDEQPESLPSDAVQSVVSVPASGSQPSNPRPNEPEHLPSVQVRMDYAESDLARQRTRPPRSRREGWVESGTPPPIGELSDAAARIALATSHAPSPLVGQPVSQQPAPTSGNRWIGVALFGVAAVAGAFALGKRSVDANPPAPVASVIPPSASALPSAPQVTSAAQPAAPTAASETESAPSSATTVDQAAATARAPAVATGQEAPAVQAPPGNVKTAPSLSPAAKTDIKPAPKAQAAPVNPAPSNPEPESPVASDPPEQPAATGPGPFDSSAAATALGNAANRASSCRQPGDPSGVARVTVTFANTGSATHAIVDGPPFAGTATGGCIAATMRGATVPAFVGDRVTVKKTVVIQ